MKKPRTSTKPRKTPRQERSRATVDAITQAATYILVEQGWERLTTNAVADRAGVNIGSLYQYFPNKEAIVAELQRRHVAESRQKLTTFLSQLPAQETLRDALRLLVRAMYAEHCVAPAVHKAIAEELPGSVRYALGEEAIDDLVLQVLRPFMKNVPDAQLAIRIAHIAAHAVIHEAVAHHPDIFDRPELVDEVVALLESYLQRPA